ncbi:hypothetical protein JCM4814A_92360 [Streptomyces phaeofaciens JCM 4814]|uniref:Uncharacterized protein n=1 Tax=Streptomyces phaeofaciens TaxID=68254 RepID=A0A918HJM6_9ACTN|nr:hypothetical protein [Streptomyces phaeofaciens]GGT70671.1 hypothetical protein GCM10010226_55700 [Streptomyces phaeofaciens]
MIEYRIDRDSAVPAYVPIAEQAERALRTGALTVEDDSPCAPSSPPGRGHAGLEHADVLALVTAALDAYDNEHETKAPVARERKEDT